MCFVLRVWCAVVCCVHKRMFCVRVVCVCCGFLCVQWAWGGGLGLCVAPASAWLQGGAKAAQELPQSQRGPDGVRGMWERGLWGT